ncbi:hypothetical protein swp_0375 [Shewanella piezotolerans WP3]|uniref:Uncharacterized protein n=1 Tax=Shewanella piezotolerans (strain WP3 / JCM 13877) TaxID=225849 RepID=B8CHT3_SHEPW|nr:hypothetical protein swp_0375 [Shewanella piezotolerans WP3]
MKQSLTLQTSLLFRNKKAPLIGAFLLAIAY